MFRIKVAVLFGGCSEEHNVSIKSAMEIAANIDTKKYQPYYIGITKSGVWKMCEKPCLEWEQYAGDPVVFSPDRSTHGPVSYTHLGLFDVVTIGFLPFSVMSIDNKIAVCKTIKPQRSKNMKNKKNFLLTGALFLLFSIFTVIVTTVDVKPIGPEQSYVGLASLNQFVFELFGVNLLSVSYTHLIGAFSALSIEPVTIDEIVVFTSKKGRCV